MTSALYSVLDCLRKHAKTEREKGAYFEELAKVHLENDPLQHDQYDQVWHYADWAAYSGMIRPPVPITSAHPFRSDPPGDSGLSAHPFLACFALL